MLMQAKKPKVIRNDTSVKLHEVVNTGMRLLREIDDQRSDATNAAREAALHSLATKVHFAMDQLRILWNTKQRTGE
jgi:hypothetical protein